MESFEISWKIDDGFVNNGPHHFTVEPEDVEDMDEAALKEYLWDRIQSEYEQCGGPVCDQESEFIEWALSVQKEAE